MFLTYTFAFKETNYRFHYKHLIFFAFVCRKVDLDKKNRGGWTPLMYACYIGHDNIVNLLLDASVNVNVQNNKGQTPLMLAASCGNESVAYFIYSVKQILFLVSIKYRRWLPIQDEV